MAFFAALGLIGSRREDAEARAQYDYLRLLNLEINAAVSLPTFNDQNAEHEADEILFLAVEAPSSEPSAEAAMKIIPLPTPSPAPSLLTLDTFSGMNPDYAGWIKIEGTTVDYPVVRGPNNKKYIRRLFDGTRNPAGSIFMDYRCKSAFNGPVAILYGHNMQDGSMLAPIVKYANEKFFREHPEILITAADGTKLIYKIFGTKETDAWDKIYTLDYNDAGSIEKYFGTSDLKRVLVLSTCLGGADRLERFLVFAAVEE